jgi:exonuclease III
MTHTILRVRWCDIVPNVHAPTEDETNNMKNSFYEKLDHVFDKFPKYQMKILLGDFNVEVGREDIL